MRFPGVWTTGIGEEISMTETMPRCNRRVGQARIQEILLSVEWQIMLFAGMNETDQRLHGTTFFE
tara:strand:- start:52 stop:246 length:195 start_codon:yes stop_codon:yes gene_type:complete